MLKRELVQIIPRLTVLHSFFVATRSYSIKGNFQLIS